MTQIESKLAAAGRASLPGPADAACGIAKTAGGRSREGPAGV